MRAVTISARRIPVFTVISTQSSQRCSVNRYSVSICKMHERKSKWIHREHKKTFSLVISIAHTAPALPSYQFRPTKVCHVLNLGEETEKGRKLSLQLLLLSPTEWRKGNKSQRQLTKYFHRVKLQLYPILLTGSKQHLRNVISEMFSYTF